MMHRADLNGHQLAEGLVQLVAHDLRAPVGPLVLAISSIAEDPALPPHAREFALMAEAQARRLGRLMTSIVWAVRGVAALAMEPCDAAVISHQAASTFRSLGGTCQLDATAAPIMCDPAPLHDALVGLMECVAGEGGDVRLSIDSRDSEVRVVIRAITRTSTRTPAHRGSLKDAAGVFALGASALLRAHAGRLEATNTHAAAILPGLHA